MSTGAARPIRRLDIRMGVPDAGDDDYVYPVARLLIDGEDPLASVGEFGYAPWPAHQLLTDNAPLLPTEPPRRVIVYAQSPDPSGLAPVISCQDDVVVWSDFHTVFEVWNDPLDFSEAYSGWPVTLPDLAFDARQYTAEVQRATAAREWESGSWQTALLLRAYLRDHPVTPGDEWELGFTEPDREHAQHYRVTYWAEDLRAMATVSLTAAPGPPEQQARAMYDYLRAPPPARWPSLQHISANDR